VQIDRDTIEANLQRKGFQQEQGDHRFYNLIFQGKKTSIRTKISIGTKYKVYGDPLLAEIKKQLRLPKKQELADLLLCPMDYEAYCARLIELGHLKP